MIVFVTHDTAPIEIYLRTYGASISGLFKVCTYDALLRTRRRPSGNYCFANLERLNHETRTRTALICDELTASGARVLNHPIRSMLRYDLLRMLSDRGTNQFNVWRASDQGHAYRFPVFVRGEHDHEGSRSPLLHTPAELEAALHRLRADGRSDNNLVVEFLDTADRSGQYRKYGAFVIGDRVIARHLFVSDHWMLKKADKVNDEVAREEREYVATNPHAAEIREIAAVAGISYGRIDYTLLNGALQVWEINLNPMLAGRSRQRRRPAARRLEPVERVRRLARPAIRRFPVARAARDALVRDHREPGQREQINATFSAELRSAWTQLASHP